MASKEAVVAGTYGRVVELDTRTDLAAFNGPTDKVEIYVEIPTGDTTTWSATIKDPTAVAGDADYGIITYTLQPGDLAEVGSYKLHARLTKTSPPMVVFGDMAVLKAVRPFENRTD